MIENVGTYDRALRVIAGCALIGVAIGLVPEYQTNWAWLGLVPLATGLLGTCPAYSLLGISTCKT
ncbi:MAG: DUF2892 domain-containing protein [Hyphomicrobium sp.]